MRIPALARVIILMSAIVAIGVAGFLFISQQSDGGDRPAEPLGIAAATASGLEQSGITVQGIGEVRIEPDTAFLFSGSSARRRNGGGGHCRARDRFNLRRGGS